MYKKIKKYFNSEKGERGVAVLFALTFMALLLVMALAFAANSLLDQKIAYNNASASATDMIAEATLNRLVTMAEFYLPDSGSYLVSTATSDNDGLSDYFSSIDLNGETVFEWTDNGNIKWEYLLHDTIVDGAQQSKIFGRYAYVIIPDGLLSPSNMVKTNVDENAQVELRFGNDINEMNIKSLDSSFFASAITSSMNYTNYDNGTQISLMPACANWVYQANLINILNGLLVANTQPELTPAQNKTLHKLFFVNPAWEREAYWIDLNDNKLVDPGVDANGDGTIDTVNNVELFQRFNLRGFKDSSVNPGYYDSGESSESNSNMWDKVANNKDNMCKYLLLDNDGDGARDANHYPPYWQNKNDYLGYDSSSTSWVDYSNPAWTDVDTTNTNYKLRAPGLLWLANFSGNTAASPVPGSFSTINKRRMQIAANLVDYCDSDNTPTSDVAAASWSSSNVPAFTGNEKTPYLNELYLVGNFMISAETNVTLWLFGVPVLRESKISLTSSFDAVGEVIDIYGGQRMACKVTVLSVTLTTAWANNSGVGSSPGGTTTITNKELPVSSQATTPADWSDGYGKSSTVEVQSSTTQEIASITTLFGGNIDYDLTGITVTSAKLMLSYDSDNDGVLDTNCDYVNITASPPADSFSAVNFLISPPPGDDETKNTSVKSIGIKIQTNDPRQNLNTNDWHVSYVYSSALPFSPGKNSNVTDISSASTTRDQEALGASAIFPSYDYTNSPNAVTQSTAYIRNAPMRSPWELGLIHRGAAWETINLKAYNKNLAINANPAGTGDSALNGGGGAYGDGDANILDQIKMTSEPKSPLKVNIMTNQTASVLTALFNKIKIGTSIEFPSGLSTELGASSDSGTEIAQANATTLATKVCGDGSYGASAAITTSTATDAWRTRAAVANIPELKDGTTCGVTQSSDATKEELIGKFINLTKIPLKTKVDTTPVFARGTNNPDYFTVVVVAQTIKDVGGAIDVTKNDSSGTPRTSSPKVEYGVFDYDNTYKVYFDEIVSTRKLLARIHRDPMTGKCKIVSYSYLD